MKKSLLTLAALLCMSVANAQLVGGYKATTKQDISIKGGTVINSNIAPADLPATVILSDASSKEWNGTSGKGFPIGFEFPFNGNNFSYFGVDALGLIRLSETEDMAMKNSNYFCTQSDEKFDNIIFCYNQSAQSYLADNEAGYEPTTISYKTTEDALVVEWKNLAVNASKWSTDLIGTYTMQIYLMKDGTISIVLLD